MDNWESMNRSLWPMHWKEVALDQDVIPLKPNFNAYCRKEEAGELFFVTARHNGNLVGYFSAVISPGLHYETCLTCMTDMFYLHPSVRGVSLPGLKMMRFAEKELRLRGVNRWLLSSKILTPDGQTRNTHFLFKRLGFQVSDIICSKLLERMP